MTRCGVEFPVVGLDDVNNGVSGGFLPGDTPVGNLDVSVLACG